jgi:hypothetical protein
MKARSVLAVALVFGAAAAGWWSCSGEPRDEQARTDAGAGGAAATGGGSGASGGASASGGAGGAGNSGGIDWGPAPKWEATNIVAATCPIERLANASEIRMFAWEPCPWAPNDCERAVFNSAVVGNNATIVGRVSTVHDDGTDVRVGLAFHSPKALAIFATGDGQGLVGIRSGSSDCAAFPASVDGKRFAVEVSTVTGGPGGSQFGGVLGDLTAPGAPVGFTLATHPPGGDQGYALGAVRWLWWWAPTYAYSSVSAVDGSDYKLVATTMPPSEFVDLESPITTGKLFLFEGFVGDEAGLAHGKIFYTDGLSVPDVYLEPSEPDTYYGRPIYANSYVAFFKGIGFQDINKYGSIELWASPFSEKPSELQPEKLAVLPDASMPGEPRGGFGFALFELAAGVNKWNIAVWNLAKNTERKYELPDSDGLMGLVGVSRQHAWVTTTNFTYTEHHLLRFRNE